MFGKKKQNSSDAVPRRRRAVETEDRLPSDVSSSTHVAPATQFRRNQTLSSYRSNTPEESSRQKAHDLARQRRRLGSIFLVVAIVIVVLILLLWQLIAQVHVTTSTKQLSTGFESSKYEKAINEYLALNPSQRLRVSLNTDDLTKYVTSELPEVEKLTLSGVSGLAQSGFTVTFRTPVAGWQINSNQYYVDASGVVFQKNYYDSPKVQIVDESGVSPEQGSAVVGTRLLGFLGKVVSQAQGRGYTPVKAVLPAGTTREVDLYFNERSTYVKFSIDRGAGGQMEDADRSLDYLQSKGVGVTYVDVRVSGRAAYR